MKNQTIFLIALIILWSNNGIVLSCPTCSHHDKVHPNIENIPPHMTLEEFCAIHGLDPQAFKQKMHAYHDNDNQQDNGDDQKEDDSIHEQDFMGIGDVYPKPETDDEDENN